MLHYYLQRGYKPEYILSLSDMEKRLFAASMELASDEHKAMFKGDNKSR